MQVFYHLGELDDALSYALGAGALFDLSERSEYVETILGEITHILCKWTCLMSISMFWCQVVVAVGIHHDDLHQDHGIVLQL